MKTDCISTVMHDINYMHGVSVISIQKNQAREVS